MQCNSFRTVSSEATKLKMRPELSVISHALFYKITLKNYSVTKRNLLLELLNYILVCNIYVKPCD